MSAAANINTISTFLSSPASFDPTTYRPVSCLVICISALLNQLDAVFTLLAARPDFTPLLVLCGGIGHSTPFLYDAVTQHPRFRALRDRINGLPEARVAEMILREFYDGSAIERSGCRVLIEDWSTNCGANAAETHRLLLRSGVDVALLQDVVLVQDPTMMLRTKVGFEMVFEDAGWEGKVLSWPVFVPEVEEREGRLKFVGEGGGGEDVLWTMDRFVGLIMGEVPRLLDNEDGYGPRGRGFIPHVEVPAKVQRAWSELRGTVESRR